MALPEKTTLADSLLELLAGQGIEVFLANPGTDFVSLIEAFVKRREAGLTTPKPLAAAHETAVMTLAHGYYLATGKPAVVMVHVGIGTANALGPLMAASRANIPVIFLAGRTPVTQSGHPGSRSAYIHWGQDVFDQAAPVREWVKWEYELRRPEELEEVLVRARSLALAQPRGPVYLTLPREILYDPLPRAEPGPPPRDSLPLQGVDPAGVAQAADWLARAENPLILTTSVGRDPAAVTALGHLAETAGAGVVSVNAEYLNLPRNHPCHQGFDPVPLLPRADVVLVVESPSPWYPGQVRPGPGAKVIHLGQDPLFSRIPMRQYPADLILEADPAPALSALTKALEDHPQRNEKAVAGWLEMLARENRRMAQTWADQAAFGASESPLSPAWVSSIVGPAIEKDWVLFNEYHNAMPPFAPDRPGSYFSTPHAGFLGWGLGAALGYKLGNPQTPVALTVGDGSYIFAAPGACHLFAETQGLPILTVVYNNSGYQAVRNATRQVHPDGEAARSGSMPLTELGDTTGLHRLVEAFGGFGALVDAPDKLAPALKEALHQVQDKGRQAVLNVIVAQS